MTDYGALPTEIRMMALGLPIPCARRRGGRPRALSVLHRIEIAMAWAEYMNTHARIEAPREREATQFSARHEEATT
jgi:hypothetical protein